jgi:hypothetical protein
MQHMSENFKLKFSNLLSNLFSHNVNNWQILQSKLKMGLKKIDTTFETFKNFNISHLMALCSLKGQSHKTSPTF